MSAPDPRAAAGARGTDSGRARAEQGRDGISGLGGRYRLEWREAAAGPGRGGRVRHRIVNCGDKAGVARAAERAKALAGEFRLIGTGGPADPPLYVTAASLAGWAAGRERAPEPLPDPSGARTSRMRGSARPRWTVCGARWAGRWAAA